MKERAITYCQQGENCSFALLHAASDVYGFPLSEELTHSCRAISGGFGIGGICSTLVAAMMVLGILFDTEEAKRKRLFFLLEFHDTYHAFECPALSAGKENCNEMIGEIADLLQKQIQAV